MNLFRPAGSIIPALLALLLLPPGARADGYRNPPPGPALGRAGAGTAGAEDASALLYNPAGIAGIEGRDATLSLSLARTRIDWTGPDGARASSRDPWQLLPNLYAAAERPGSPWRLGLGAATPFGQSVEWPGDSPFRYQAPYFAEIGMINLTPAAARRLSTELAAGAGLDVYLSRVEFRQHVPWGLLLDAPGLPDGEIRAAGEGAALGGRFGLSWDPAPGHRFAASYRSRFRVRYRGDFTVRGAPAEADAGARDFSTRIRYPDILAAGYAVRLTGAWRAEFQVERMIGSVNREQPLDIEAPYDRLVPDSRIVNRWRDTWTFGAGTDWAFAPGWTARAGYAYMESPVPDQTLSPLLPDSDRQVFAVGLGRQFGSHALDLAYTHNRFRSRTTPLGRFDYAADLLGLSYGLRF